MAQAHNPVIVGILRYKPFRGNSRDKDGHRVQEIEEWPQTFGQCRIPAHNARAFDDFLEFIHQNRGDDELPAALRHAVDRFLAAARNNGDLKSAYQRLFVGPARPRVYPYESCYRDPSRRLAGPWAEQVAAGYTAEGLACPGLLPDHIAEAFWLRLTRRLEPSDPSARAARRCPACREAVTLPEPAGG